MEKFVTEYLPRRKYAARERSSIKHLLEFFGEEIVLQDIERSIALYEDFRAAKGAAPATIVKELGLLRRMLNLAIKKWKWIRENPFSQVELPKVRNERVRYLSPDEQERLFSALKEAPEWLYQIVLLALNTGLRQSNILKLRWREVNLFSRMLILEGVQMKNGENFSLPLTREAFTLLKELNKKKSTSGYVITDSGEPIYQMKLQREFRKACRKAGITDFRFHDLRHSFASYLRQQGVDLHVISRLLGHKDIRMTQRYSHLSVENLRDAISMLDRKNGDILVTVGSEEPEEKPVNA